MYNNSQNLKKSKKISVLLSVLFFILACLVFFFLYKKIENNKQERELMQTKWQTELNRRNEIRFLERAVKEINNEKNLLETHFAQGSNVVPFLDTMEQLARKAKAKSEIIAVDLLKDKGSLSVLIKTEGSFESIYKFLLLLENSPYELEFVSVDMRNTKGLVPWEANFKIILLSFIQ